ncbi:MAG: 3-dehydroquinate dehydratase [Acholeplasmataceae bacterium]|nr:3-dehydroquinate dehydratase [Acholeplasmataceae bacterium]
MNILVIHGPNLNMLGRRNPELYGSMTQDELFDALDSHFDDVDFVFYQSNYEGELIGVIHSVMNEDYNALIINPGALTHTSIALRDALEMLEIPKVEVHLSNIDQREAYRKVDYIKEVVDACFMGKKLDSYIDAVEFLLNKTVV